MRRPSTKPIKGFQPPQVRRWLKECDINELPDYSNRYAHALHFHSYVVGKSCLRTFGGDADRKVIYPNDAFWQCRLSQRLSHPGEKAQRQAQGWLLLTALRHAVQQTVLLLGRSELPPPHSCPVLQQAKMMAAEAVRVHHVKLPPSRSPIASSHEMLYNVKHAFLVES